jgi:hypothetical protein
MRNLKKQKTVSIKINRGIFVFLEMYKISFGLCIDFQLHLYLSPLVFIIVVVSFGTPLPSFLFLLISTLCLISDDEVDVGLEKDAIVRCVSCRSIIPTSNSVLLRTCMDLFSESVLDSVTF